jgi:hypothetical protein
VEMANFMIEYLGKYDIVPEETPRTLEENEEQKKKIDLVDNYLTELKGTWPLKKFLTAFK